MNLPQNNSVLDSSEFEMPIAGALNQLLPKHDLCGTKEAAKILQTPLPTVYFLAQNKRLPAFRVGGRWRFYRSKLWQMVNASNNNRATPMSHSRGEKSQSSLKARISQAISEAISAADGQSSHKIVVCLVFDKATDSMTSTIAPDVVHAFG
jgi:excisionase family DNA binding protein